MNFEQIQAVWDSQEEKTVFVVDPDEVVREVRGRSMRTRRAATLEELMIVFTCTFFPAINGYFSGEHLYESVGAVINLGIVAYVLVQRGRRLRRERAYESTLLGELDRALFRVTRAIRRWQTFGWWFLVPLTVYTAISLTQHFTWTGALAAAIGYPLAWLVVQLSWKRGYLPEKRNLEALRAELAASPT